jgi:hypothetical protein
MQKNSFSPQTITINQGDTVLFENVDSQDRWPASNIHPTHEIYPEFDPKKPVPANTSWQFTFDKAGTWKYHDHLEPTLSGTVIVKAMDSVATEAPAKLSFWQRLSHSLKTWWRHLWHRQKEPVRTSASAVKTTYNDSIQIQDESIFTDDNALAIQRFLHILFL